MSHADYSSTAQKEGEEFAATVSKFMNSFNTKRQEVAVEKMVKDHRSLQQATIRFFMLYIAKMAENSCDGRNEASVKLAKAIMELPENVRHLPKI